MAWQRNPNCDKFVKPAGYDDLGWQLNYDNPALVKCREAKHKTRKFDNSLYLCQCTDEITICDECKYVYHTDMSD